MSAAVDNSRFLASVRQVEGHRWSDPGGAYAISRSVWVQHSSLPYSYASDKAHAEVVAHKHIGWLSAALTREGWTVSVYTLAGAWRWGFEGFKRRAVRGRLEYAERCRNLYHAP